MKDTSRQEVGNDISENETNPIRYWIRKGTWPQEYFKQDTKSRKYFELENNMSHLLARTKSTSSLRRKLSDSSDVTSSDQWPREEKSGPYKIFRYKIVLETKGSFMNESDLGITDKSKSDYQNLLMKEQTVPTDSLFRGDMFKSTCQNIQDKNETRVIRDISLLIVPSAETLATQGAINLLCLTESTNEGWNNSIPVTTTRPQPDYSVGFRRSAFTNDQLKKLRPFVGDLYDTSFFMATYYMYFPFLTCEVKCGAAALDIADRQNAHSMTIAIRGIVELFKYVKCEKKLDREILAFSISHDHESVRIYGHYALINGSDTTFYRHSIRKFDFTEQDGKDKWTTYKFTRNVYDIWMPTHLERIRSAIDKIPADSFTFIASIENESELLDSQETVSSSASFHDILKFKKPKLRPTVMLQQENDRQKEQIDELKEQLKDQNDRFDQERKQNKQERIQEKEESKLAMNELKEQLKQRDDKLDRLMNMLEQRFITAL